ncbi:MAG TPA: DUF1552 domain-containing protein [Planctomycetota bacterium]|nr:DUF1552 domain-containing protein [Planctomycetota bacterium]
MMDRRMFLRGAGTALALPWLESLAGAQDRPKAEVPRRMIAIETNQGILPQEFFPREAGRDYTPTPYLEILREFRGDLTVFSGVSHPQVDGFHQAEKSFLTAAPHPGSPGFRNTISLDQLAAESIGDRTRIASLPIIVSTERGRGLSYTRSGVLIPPEYSPARLYERLFVQGTPQEVERAVEELRLGRSLLDAVRERAKELSGRLGARDRERLDQYTTSVFELEEHLRKAEAWERRPKPKVKMAKPADITDGGDLVGRTRLMYDLVRLALETDSTRLVTIFITTEAIVARIPGVSHETHSLTHHGGRPETLAELKKVEEAQFGVLAGLLRGLKEAQEGGQTLLDRTMVLYGTCMGNANSHDNRNLPVLLAGGGFRHGQHLAFDSGKNYPLPNLFVSMLQRLGIETDRFASSTGTMKGLELAG